jgi:hypothetical protein
LILALRITGILIALVLGLMPSSKQARQADGGDEESDFHFGVEIRPDFRAESERTLGKNGWL